MGTKTKNNSKVGTMRAAAESPMANSSHYPVSNNILPFAIALNGVEILRLYVLPIIILNLLPLPLR